jgi:peptide/nickel transport system permease protein
VIRWALVRTGEAILLTLLGAIVLVALVRLLPGDPLAAAFGEQVIDPATAAALRDAWHLDAPLPVAIAEFLRGALRGDLGMSIAESRPVTALLLERVGPTLLLGGLTLLIHFTVGLMIGLWSALHPRHPLGRMVGAVTLATYSLPAFVIGLVLVWLFAVATPLLPPAGFADPLLGADAPWSVRVADTARHLVLPLATMVLASIAVPIRHQRAAALETANAPWVTAARARGVSPLRVAWHHVWRPALTPIVTLLGLWLPLLVSGAVFVEAVFAWPGLGSLIASATATRDIPVVIGAGVMLIAVVQLGSLVADVLYRVVDPRVGVR